VSLNPLDSNVEEIGVEGDVVRYRVHLGAVELDFSSLPRLEYTVFVRASEAVNPTVMSQFTAPCITQVNDPLPPVVPQLPLTLRWTALPDATGKARMRLALPQNIEHAAGYVVYEATEPALLTAAGQPPLDAAASLEDSIFNLQDALNSGLIDNTFRRLNTALLAAPEVEVNVPGAAGVLYAYSFAAVTSQQVESERMTPTLVGVSTRVTPAAPQLTVRRLGDTNQVMIRVRRGDATLIGGLSLHRTNFDGFTDDVDLMGPSVADPDDIRWQFDEITGEFVLVDTVNPGWRPCYYRVVAFGIHDPDNGLLAGRSLPSNLAEILIPPGDPVLSTVEVAPQGATLMRAVIRTAAEVRRTTAGDHRLEFLLRNLGAITPGLPRDLRLAQATLTAIAARPEAIVPGQIYRGERNAAGEFEYETFFDTNLATPTHVLIVRITDPLGRVTEQQLGFGSGTAAAPPPSAPASLDLVNLELVATKTGHRLSIQSSESIEAPSFTLELYTVGIKGKPTLIVRENLHEISTIAIAGHFLRSRRSDANHRFTYQFTFNTPLDPRTIYIVRLISPKGLQHELRSDS
jgi:hypothetical protein